MENPAVQSTYLSINIPNKISLSSKIRTIFDNKRNRIIGVVSVSVLILLIVGVILYSKNKNQVQYDDNVEIPLAADVKNRIIYLGDNDRIYITDDQGKGKEAVTPEGVRVKDFIISPNRDRIAYSVIESDYLSKIKFDGVDLSKIKIKEYGTQVYELTLEDRKSVLIYDLDEIIVDSPSAMEYKSRTEVKDTYEQRYGYDSNGEWKLISYPVSHPLSGSLEYTYEQLSYEVDLTLRVKTPILLDYDPSNAHFAFSINNGEIATYSSEKASLKKYLGNLNKKDCSIAYATWQEKYIVLTNFCYEGSTQTVLIVSPDKMEIYDNPILQLFSGFGVSNRIQFIKNNKMYISSIYRDENAASITSQLKIFDFTTDDFKNPIAMDSETIFDWIPNRKSVETFSMISKYYDGKTDKSIARFNFETNSFEILLESKEFPTGPYSFDINGEVLLLGSPNSINILNINTKEMRTIVNTDKEYILRSNRFKSFWL